MNKDFIKWLAIDGIKTNIKEWQKLKDYYVQHLLEKQSEAYTAYLKSGLATAEYWITQNEKLLEEVKNFEM
jgi:hypothetical protein